jgi:hypothetical protein
MITPVKQTVVVNCSLLYAFQPRRILNLLSYLRQEKTTFYTQALHIFIQSCSCCMPLTRYSFGGLATGKITFIIISSSLIICCLKDASKKISNRVIHILPSSQHLDINSPQQCVIQVQAHVLPYSLATQNYSTSSNQ